MPGKAKAATPVNTTEKQQHQNRVHQSIHDPQVWTAFCDGSALRNPGPGGAGALVVVPPAATAATAGAADDKQGCTVVTRQFVSPAVTTNNIMELKGIELALDLLERQGPQKPRWTIYTDSMYCRNLFEKGYTARANTEIVTALRARLASLSSSHNVTIRIEWVKAHCGIAYNEHCDRLASAAAKQCLKALGPLATKPKKAFSKQAIIINRIRPRPAPAADGPAATQEPVKKARFD